MCSYHPTLAAGRWQKLTFDEQMANVGSEVERALRWKERSNSENSAKAFDRALELIDLTLVTPANRNRLKEIARAREVFVDLFYGEGQLTSADSLRQYFLQFAFADRKNKV